MQDQLTDQAADAREDRRELDNRHLPVHQRRRHRKTIRQTITMMISAPNRETYIRPPSLSRLR